MSTDQIIESCKLAEEEFRKAKASLASALNDRDKYKNAFHASERLRAGKYISWANAGGPEECQHGYDRSIPCPKCDEALVQSIS